MTDLADLADEPFVSLTTFRKSGAPIATPLWLVAYAGGVAFWTPRGSGKVKRLRNNPAVELRPCGRRGNVAPDAPMITGRAVVVDDAEIVEQIATDLRSKYGLQFRAMSLIEKARPQLADRVVIEVRQ